MTRIYNFIIDNMDQDLYDEFGNYIGPQIMSDSSSEEEELENNQEQPQNEQVINASNEHKIVLHEDKKYYQSHEQMYPEAQIMIEQQDRQTLQTPIVNKSEDKFYDHYEELKTYYQTDYLLQLMKTQPLIRNICVAGHLGHGKSLLMDMLIQQTHLRKWDLEKNYRWMDSRVDEQERKLTVKTSPITLLLTDSKEKNYVFNMMDTPGHPNFIGQFVAALRICDGVVLVVDAIEGVMLMTQIIIKHIVRQNLNVVVVMNKIDRLIIEQKIPPEDAYLKIKHTLEQINTLFQQNCSDMGIQNRYKISPALNNVIFASAEYSFMFSIQSMVEKYQSKFPQVQPHIFKKILWGDFYYSKNAQKNKFSKRPHNPLSKRTFVEFILEPIYKIFAHTVGKDRMNLQQFLLHNLQVKLSPEEYKLNIKTMIKLIFWRYFEINTCFVSSIIGSVEFPKRRVSEVINRFYRGEKNDFINRIQNGQSDGPLFIQTVKMYHKKDYKSFDVLGRVFSGTVKKGMDVRIMGQNYEVGDEEDMFIKKVQKIYLLQGRYRIQVDSVSAGNFVLIEGIDQAITKTSTIVDANIQSSIQVDIMIPLKFWTQSVIKVSIQPLIPSELPKMIEAIRKVNKSYLLLKTKVQESGEHVLIGTGQIHLDSILHDIRNLYSDIEVRISDPCVTMMETVAETSGIPCYADTPNKKNRIKVLASPLAKGISDTVEKQLINVNDKQQVRNFLQTKYNWDVLASSNVWTFGPQPTGPNVLVNDTFVNQVNQAQLNRVRQSIVQGFRWSTREGPLCDQPMRNTKFRIIDAELSQNPQNHPPGQVIPTARRAFYSSFLTANPRLMEPIYTTEIEYVNKDAEEAIFSVLAKRRGNVYFLGPKPGTPNYIMKAHLPCLQTLGFQTDLRLHTVGQAFCLSVFDHWQVLPGDPLDKNVTLRPLEVMQSHELARELLIKTRRRKGLNEEVSIVKYFDDLNIKEVLKNDISFKNFI